MYLTFLTHVTILLSMDIPRNWHLGRLVARKHNKMIKIITGMRRSGKSYLLFNLFYEHLKSQGVDDRHIIRINLEDWRSVTTDITYSLHTHCRHWTMPQPTYQTDIGILIMNIYNFLMNEHSID